MRCEKLFEEVTVYIDIRVDPSKEIINCRSANFFTLNTNWGWRSINLFKIGEVLKFSYSETTIINRWSDSACFMSNNYNNLSLWISSILWKAINDINLEKFPLWTTSYVLFNVDSAFISSRTINICTKSNPLQYPIFICSFLTRLLTLKLHC